MAASKHQRSKKSNPKNIITQKYLFPGAFHGPGKPQGSKVKLPIFGFEFPMGKTYPKPK
jgi:hypothetical protein